MDIIHWNHKRIAVGSLGHGCHCTSSMSETEIAPQCSHLSSSASSVPRDPGGSSIEKQCEPRCQTPRSNDGSQRRPTQGYSSQCPRVSHPSMSRFVYGF